MSIDLNLGFSKFVVLELGSTTEAYGTDYVIMLSLTQH